MGKLNSFCNMVNDRDNRLDKLSTKTMRKVKHIVKIAGGLQYTSYSVSICSPKFLINDDHCTLSLSLFLNTLTNIIYGRLGNKKGEV